MKKDWIYVGWLIMVLAVGSPLWASDDIAWDHYHNYDEVTEILEGFARDYDSLCRLSSIGKSYQGRDIWCLTITNYATGEPDTKPAHYIEGNVHGGEVSGTEVALYTIHYLLTRYDDDPVVKTLLDEITYYILPRINPDGSEEYLREPGAPFPVKFKFDDDDDGKEDEDDVEDLNGDGIISVMRIRDPRGSLKTSPDDPRLMVERSIDEEGEWRIVGPEGIDNDGDGKINEDTPGKRTTVTNRNYPAYWAPEWIQSGAGEYPLSQPEAKAQVEFVLARPNIGITQAYHTFAGVILYGYCGQPLDRLPAEDLHNMRAIGKLGEEMTGYMLASTFEDFTTDKSSPRHGDFTDWIYEHAGAMGAVIEIWEAPDERKAGVKPFGKPDEVFAMKWNDRELGGKGFIDWQPYDHPEFGEVEIGGWNFNFFRQNPPPEFAEAEWEKVSRFELKRSEMLPRLRLNELKTESMGDGLVRITTEVENNGFLPTYITRKAVENGIAKSVEVILELTNAELLWGKKEDTLGHLKGNGPQPSSWQRGRATPPLENVKSIEWLVKVTGKDASAAVTARTPKAGRATRSVALPRK
jgi:hypothetical protein